jgi:urea transporter
MRRRVSQWSWSQTLNSPAAPAATAERLEQAIGKPADTTGLDLTSIDLDLCGLVQSKGTNGLQEISAYAAFIDSAGKTSMSSVLNNMPRPGKAPEIIDGDAAALVRRSLFTTHFIVLGCFLGDGLDLLLNLSTNIQKNRRVQGHRYGFRDHLLSIRPCFFGTASGLNAVIKRKLACFPITRNLTIFVFNDILRGYGNMYWCCNPWTGLLIFIALLLEDQFSALCCFVAVLASILWGRALGAPPILLELGLIQYRAILVAQLVLYRDIATPPQAAWALVPILKVMLLIIVSTAFVIVLNIGTNALLISSTKICDFGLTAHLATFAIFTVGLNSKVFDLNFDKGLPYVMDPAQQLDVALSQYDLTYDYAKVLRAMFGSAGVCFWLTSTRANILIWAGIYICSPINCATYFIGGVTGILTQVAMGLPAGLVEAGYSAWAPAIVTLVMAGMVNVPSYAGLMSAVLCAMFTTMIEWTLGSTFLGSFGLPATGLAHSISQLMWTMLRFVRTSTIIPVDVAICSTPEDHYFQMMKANKAFEELAHIMSNLEFDDNDTSNDSAASKAKLTTAWQRLKGSKQTVHRAMLPKLRAAWHTVLDFVLLVTSYGAFNKTELLFDKHAKPEHHRLPSAEVVQEIRGIFSTLEEMDIDHVSDDGSFKARLFAILLLSGDCTLSRSGLEKFERLWNELHEMKESAWSHGAESDSHHPHGTCDVRDAEVMLVTMLLQSSRKAMVGAKVDTFMELFDTNGDGSISEQEFASILACARPGDPAVGAKVKELFAIADTNRNGNLEPEELKHCILSSDSEQHAAADLYVFVHNICSTIPKPKPAVPLGAAEALQEFVEYTARNAKDFAKANWRMVRSNITRVVRSVRVAADTPAIVPG